MSTNSKQSGDLDIRSCLGRNVRKYRERKGWTQVELAAQTGLNRSYISGIERGIRNPTVTIVQELADSFGISAALLLSK